MSQRYTGRPFRGPFRQIMRTFSALHIVAYRLTAGRIGGWLTRTAPVLLLTTRGRRSGKNRVTPLIYLVDGADVVVVGSLGGSSTAPAWWHNLQAYPRGRVQIGGRRWTVRATEATGTERERLWSRLVEIYPPYADYARATSRPIPVVVLHPQDQAGTGAANQGAAIRADMPLDLRPAPIINDRAMGYRTACAAYRRDPCHSTHCAQLARTLSFSQWSARLRSRPGRATSHGQVPERSRRHVP